MIPRETLGEVGLVCDDSGDGNGFTNGDHPAEQGGVAMTTVTATV